MGDLLLSLSALDSWMPLAGLSQLQQNSSPEARSCLLLTPIMQEPFSSILINKPRYAWIRSRLSFLRGALWQNMARVRGQGKNICGSAVRFVTRGKAEHGGARLCSFLSAGVPGLWDIPLRGEEMKQIGVAVHFLRVGNCGSQTPGHGNP